MLLRIGKAMLLLAVAAGQAQAQLMGPVEHLGEADARLIVERFADTGNALGDVARASEHFAPLALPVEGRPATRLTGTVAGLSSISFRRGDAWPDETAVHFTFAQMQDVAAFRALLEETFGGPDPACSTAGHAHWRIEPGLSLSWRADEMGYISSSLSLLDADPPDGNCTHSSAREGALVDVGEMTAFLRRWRDEPPPLRDVSAMAQWFEPFGEAELSRDGECSATIWNYAVSGLGGIGAINAELHLCAVLPTDRRSSLMLMGDDADMFGWDRAREALEAAFGPKHACSDELRDVWALSDDLTVLLSELFPAFFVLAVDAPVDVLDECDP